MEVCAFGLGLGQPYRPVRPGETTYVVFMLTELTSGKDEDLGAVTPLSSAVGCRGTIGAADKIVWRRPNDGGALSRACDRASTSSEVAVD